MGGGLGFVGDLISGVTLGMVDVRDKPKKQQQQMQVEQAAEDKDVQTKRIKTRQNIFNLSGVKGEELESGQVKNSGGIYSA